MKNRMSRRSRSHPVKVFNLERKCMPLGPRPALDRLLQSASNLWDRSPGIGRPDLEPFPQPAVVDTGEITLRETPSPHTVDRSAEDRAIAVPGPTHFATLDSPSTLDERQQRQVMRAKLLGIASRVGLAGPPRDSVGSFGSLLKELKGRPIRLDPSAELRVGFGPGDRCSETFLAGRQRTAAELFVRSPKECEGVLIVRNAKCPERRDIERIADIREPVETLQPPNCESRSGDRKANRHDERDPQQLAESLAQQLKHLLRRTTHRRGCGTFGFGLHENGDSRRSKIRSLTLTPF